jgi:peroxiredoxin
VIQAGQPAPEGVRVFTKPGEVKTLKELRGDGPAVLLFFPLAFSGVCTKEMCSIADDFAPWADLGASVIALSVDSPFTNVKFAESTNAQFPIVSDFNREAMTAFDVERDDLLGMHGVSERAAFVIDRDGMIQYAWVGENPGVFPPMEEIRAAVRELK